MKAKRIIYPLLIALLAFPALSQQSDQGSPFFASYPESGSWYAMDDSNTGFFLTSQNGVMAGAYFGFDAEGENVWLLFNGLLEPVFNDDAPALQTGWRLDTALTQAANGGCILDCTQQNTEARQVDAVASIALEFTGRSSASYSIDDSETVSIIPLYFGTSAVTEEFLVPRDQPDGSIEFERLLLSHPDLEGTWLVAVSNVSDDTQGGNTPAALADSAGLIEIGPQEFIPIAPIGVPPAILTTTFSQTLILSDSTGFFMDGAMMNCSFFEVIDTSLDAESGGACEIDAINGDLFPQATDVFAFGDIRFQNDSRFVMFINARGPEQTVTPRVRLEFFRLGYN